MFGSDFLPHISCYEQILTNLLTNAIKYGDVQSEPGQGATFTVRLPFNS
jgi:signal transduction histidine kinase